jgi:hypothetical protein
MFDWLNHNSGAVQAVCAVFIAVLTLLLFWTTRRYTQLTSRIARVTEKQLAASVQPVLAFFIQGLAIGSGSDYAHSVSFDAIIRNDGASPAKL